MTNFARRFSGSSAAVFLLGLSVLVLSGCSQKRVELTGKVLEKGKPITGAELRWVSETDTTVFASGVSLDDGGYVMESGGKKGLPPGHYKVSVNWWRTRDGKPLPKGEEGTAMKGTPKSRAYTATLDVDVTPEKTNLDLDVTGKGQLVEEDY